MSAFVHQVEIKLSEAAATERLRRIESWCAGWEIRFHVVDRQPGSEHVRLAFEEHRLARAFVCHFGGVLMDGCKVEAAMEKDAPDEDALYRIARESDGE
ncbi:hypothetical protein SAMN05428997_12415 [Bosea sp. CRIB-10]|jgi:hypothetical protein|uniref:hypothetical protein n=1 Tax=Bosea sp. CRIB-10 TaxID=378404 RepID=UPI0008E6CD91|nr:hypothetical protein [Bosea sp. CRIB-10]SFD30764.1 hypothetical protein SAMN05428997_12415 [Bosea sp. CRIB-10]